MKIFGIEVRRATEQRASPENPLVPVSAGDFLSYFGQGSVSLPRVTVDNALAVPAVWSAVAFLSRTMANLPIHAFKKDTRGNAARVKGGIEPLLNEAPNDTWTAFRARQYFWQQVFTIGRGLFYIERNTNGVPLALWPMNTTKTTVGHKGGRRSYKVPGQTTAYDEADVIDVAFMLKADQVSVYGPIAQGAKAIQLALAMNDYGSKFFAGGGVPPLSLAGPLPSGPEAMARAAADIKASVKSASAGSDAFVQLPPGYELKPIGFDPAKGQMTEARRFQVEEIARVYNLPPAFLQDLTHGTFSNVEQQDLNLVKHLVTHWASALEQEFTLKLYAAPRRGRYVEHIVDGLLRGDFKTRMDGFARGIQSGQITPDEARSKENRPPMKGGDQLFIQGATVPLDKAGTQPPAPSAPPTPPADGDGDDTGDNDE